MNEIKNRGEDEPDAHHDQDNARIARPPSRLLQKKQRSAVSGAG